MSAATNRLAETALGLVEKDPGRARALMEQAAASGDPDAVANLAVFVAQGVGKPADPQRARELFEQAVAAGSNMARANLARMLLEEGDEAGWLRAAVMLREAAQDPLARPATLYAMGRATLFGRGVTRDLKAGMALLQESLTVDPENADALYLVGRGFQNGWGGARDLRLAARYFKLSADRRDLRALREYGRALLQGEGVAVDAAAAAGAFRQAAQQGDRTAMVDLAVMLATGEAGTLKDPAEARKWYLEAASLGSAHALCSLGSMLYVGEGGAPDLPTGWAYLELAAEAGVDRAAAFMEQRSPPEHADRAAIDAIKADWRSKHPMLVD